MAVLDERVERAQCFLDRGRGVETMNLVEVDMIQLKAFEARLARVDQVVARGTTTLGPWPVWPKPFVAITTSSRLIPRFFSD